MRFKLMSVSMGPGSDNIWVLDDDNRIWIYNDGDWVNDPNGRAQQISVGNGKTVWCVNPSGQIFSGTVSDDYQIEWEENSLPEGTLAHKVAAGIDGEVWSLDQNNRLWQLAADGGWTLDADAKDVSNLDVGSGDFVCCVNKDGGVFKRAGTAWEEISDNNTDVRELSVSGDGFICYVAQNFDLRIYDNGGFDPEGTGRGLSVSAASADDICIVNDDAELWRCIDEEWDEVDGPNFKKARVYFVKEGDTLSEIAEGLGLELDALLAANTQIANPDVVNVGDRVNLPA